MVNSCVRMILIGTSILIATGCDEEGLLKCDRVMRNEAISADASMKAAIEDVQCGATTRDASWVLLTKASSRFSDKRDQIAVFEGHVNELKWENGALVVLHGDAVPFKTTEIVGSIKVVYRAN